MIRTDSRRGRIALMVGHCAGMVDMVALPVWIGTLISQYGLDPQQAGSLATLFLVGAVVASLVFAPRLQRLNGRWVSTAGFGLAAIGFGIVSRLPMAPESFSTLAALHGFCGLATGAALSVTHGTIARSHNPHRLFALVGIALGIFAVIFLGAIAQAVVVSGGQVLFHTFAGVMVVGAIVSVLAFPQADEAGDPQAVQTQAQPISRAVWFGIVGVACMGLVQAMSFSFLERAGNDRGFGAQAVTAVLIALGLVNLLPAALAALLEKRWPARTVMITGAILQAGLVGIIMGSSTFPPYAAAASVFVAVMIFTHTFAFGLLARLDPSGRALAATPAMLMVGAAVGPVLGGTLVKTMGYGSLGIAAAVIAAVAVTCFSRLPREGVARSEQEAVA